MKQLFVIFLSVSFLFSCNTIEKPLKPKVFNKVEMETILEDTLLNVRAIETLKDADGLVFANSKGDIGILDIASEKIRYPIAVSDSLKLNFRAIAKTKSIFALSIGSPAYMFKIDEDIKKMVYQEDHEKAFYDSMDFWNEKEGIAIGDPTDDCMSIIITRDGGETWNKLSCDALPKAKEGEAAFAASDSNIAIVGDKTWVATGGKSSRILFSPDKGVTWQVYKTPIIQGLETTGMYSVDFYDELHGFAVGGDYTKADVNLANKIRTADGGKTWEVVSDGVGPGYRSCVQYVPNSKAKQLVAIGFKGIDYSTDAGNNWSHLSDEGFYTLRFVNDSTAYAAGAGRISKLTFKE